MTHIFVTRLELLPAGESFEDLKKAQQEEAALVEKDKGSIYNPGVGIFNGRFKSTIARLAPIRDLRDGVDRCPMCTWEIEDGICGSCGYRVPSGDDDEHSFDSDGMSYSSLADEILTHHHEMHADHGYYREAEFIPFQPGAVRPSTLAQARRQYLSRRRRLDSAPPIDLSEHDNMATDSESYSSYMDNSDSDDAGSLESFVVNEDQARHFSALVSARSSRGSTEDMISVDGDLQSYSSSNDGASEPVNDRLSVDPRDDGPIESEDDSDVVSILPPRRMTRRRITTVSSSGSSNGGNSEPRQMSRRSRRIRDRQHPGLNPVDRISRSQHRSGGRASLYEPIEIESDSDSPPVRRAGHRVRVPASVSSDEDNLGPRGVSISNAEIQSSHGSTPTLHESTALRSEPTAAGHRSNSLLNSTPTVSHLPISVQSSPIRRDSMETNQSRQRSVVSPRQQSSSRISMEDVPYDPGSAHRLINGSQSRSRHMLPTFRGTAHTQNSRSPQSNRESTARRKADRKRIKEERRRREQARGYSTQSSNPTAAPQPLAYIG